MDRNKGSVLPLISVMFYRIGNRKPILFAISGYQQAPINDAAQKYSAGITRSGVYEWVRVPMVFRGAQSYLQRENAHSVLGGILDVKCELYFKDLIICGNPTTNFKNNLDEIIAALAKLVM